MPSRDPSIRRTTQRPRFSGSRGWIVTPQKFLRPEQVHALREQLEADRLRGLERDERKLVRDAAIVEVLLGTGLRVSEACALAVGDVSFDLGLGSVLVRRGKGGKARLVAIPDRLVEYIDVFVSWKADAGESVEGGAPLFVSERGGAMSRSAVHRIWKAALGRAGLPGTWGVHATRHSYAVEVYRRTRDLRLTQKLLGHSSVLTTTVYASLLDDDVRRGVAMIWS